MLQAQLHLTAVLCVALFYFLLFVIHHVYFSQIKDTFWIVQEYPQLSQADFFSANMQEIMNIRILKSFLMLFGGGSSLEARDLLSLWMDISKQMT